MCNTLSEFGLILIVWKTPFTVLNYMCYLAFEENVNVHTLREPRVCKRFADLRFKLEVC